MCITNNVVLWNEIISARNLTLIMQTGLIKHSLKNLVNNGIIVVACITSHWRDDSEEKEWRHIGGWRVTTNRLSLGVGVDSWKGELRLLLRLFNLSSVIFWRQFIICCLLPLEKKVVLRFRATELWSQGKVSFFPLRVNSKLASYAKLAKLSRERINEKAFCLGWKSSKWWWFDSKIT